MARHYSVDDMIKCIAREAKIRQRVYSKWVNDGKMEAKTAEWETECMYAVLEKLSRDSGRSQPELL
jgi:hypothetical protein